MTFEPPSRNSRRTVRSPRWGFRAISAAILLSPWSVGAADSDLDMARRALQERDYSAAEVALRRVALDHPRSGEVWHNLGIALHLQGKSRQAIEAFQKALKISKSQGTLALLGLNYCRVRNYDAAIPLLARAKEDFDDLRALAILGPCYLETRDPLDAVKVYRRLVDSETQPVDENQVRLARAYFRAAQQLTNRLESMAAGGPFHEVLRTAGTGGPRATVAAALDQAPGLRADMAIEDLNLLYETRPDDPALIYLLALACGERAMESFLQTARKFPDSPHIRRLTAEMHASQGDTEATVQQYEAILRTGPAPPGVHHDLALLYRDRAEWTSALEHFRAELEVAPFETRAIRGVSDCLARLGRDEENREYLLRLSEDGPIPAWALLQLGAIEQRARRYEIAAKYLKRATREHPDLPEARYRLGRLYLSMGDERSAKRELDIFRDLEREMDRKD